MGGLTRKELLAGAAAAGVVAGCGGSSNKPAAFDPRDWASVKAQFALSRDVRHFDAFVLATHPKPVREAIERHRRGLDADPAGYIHAHELELDERVLQAAARYLEVPPEFAFTDSTTMGLGLVYGGIRIEGRPVATEHDFYSTHESLRLRFKDFETIRLYDDPAQATVSGMVEAARAGVRDGTGLLALTWVHSGTGRQDPGRRRSPRPCAATARSSCSTASTASPPTTCRSTRSTCSSPARHKWLGGPRGTGLVWSEAWDRLRPFIPTFHPGSPAASWNPGGYHTFEHRWALAEAFDFHHRIGRTKVTKRIQSLATRLKRGPGRAAQGAAGDADGRGGVGGHRVLRGRRARPADGGRRGCGASTRWRRRSRPTREPYVRLGTGLWVDEADVDAALSAIARL